jgi:transglutaminase-like putative cysteine protease
MVHRMACYRVIHDTHYLYDAPVALSRQLLHLTPRELPQQQCLEHRLRISPMPSFQQQRQDAFGNAATMLAFEAAHDELWVRAESTVEVFPPDAAALADTPAWESVRNHLLYRAGRPPSAATLAALQYRFGSPYGRVKRKFANYAADCFPPGRPLLDGVIALNGKIHREFTFDPEATTVATPVTDVLARRRGVCQDFAHLMVSCLRSIGLAARYVSGYILTTPPPGQRRLIGADASHAWVSVWCPGEGRGNDEGRWLDADPTNNLLPGSQHVTLAWGRDFGDVSPLRGVILGGGEQELKVRVTMLPLDELPLDSATVDALERL